LWHIGFKLWINVFSDAIVDQWTTWLSFVGLRDNSAAAHVVFAMVQDGLIWFFSVLHVAADNLCVTNGEFQCTEKQCLSKTFHGRHPPCSHLVLSSQSAGFSCSCILTLSDHLQNLLVTMKEASRHAFFGCIVAARKVSWHSVISDVCCEAESEPETADADFFVLFSLGCSAKVQDELKHKWMSCVLLEWKQHTVDMVVGGQQFGWCVVFGSPEIGWLSDVPTKMNKWCHHGHWLIAKLIHWCNAWACQWLEKKTTMRIFWCCDRNCSDGETSRDQQLQLAAVPVWFWCNWDGLLSQFEPAFAASQADLTMWTALRTIASTFPLLHFLFMQCLCVAFCQVVSNEAHETNCKPHLEVIFWNCSCFGSDLLKCSTLLLHHCHASNAFCCQIASKTTKTKNKLRVSKHTC